MTGRLACFSKRELSIEVSQNLIRFDVTASLPGALQRGQATDDKLRLILPLAYGATHSFFHKLRHRLAIAEQLFDFGAQFRFDANRGDRRSFHWSLYRICITEADVAQVQPHSQSAHRFFPLLAR